MRVILLENVKGVGQIGDIKDIRDGYARNFLIPRNLAKLATKGALKEIDQLKLKLARVTKATIKESVKTAEMLADFVLEIKSRANSSGKLYAALSANHVVAELKKQGVVIDEDDISLEESVKRIGEYDIKIRLQPDLESTLKLSVIRE